ncbi:MAG: extracellular solute-binding protein, partial [Clostridia bacterium]|nr:extracellular solute-binding protein [Clostridia bacterium]
MKKLFALLLALALCLSMSALAEINAEGLPISTEVITLTAAANQSPIQGDFNEMVILKDFAEESNVHIEFQNIPASDRATQLSLMLGSGELPDILFKMAVTDTDQAKYADQGMFVALSDYAEYAPNLFKWFDEYPTAKDAVTKSDGKIYAAPYILAGDAIRMGAKLWFNTDITEKLGWDHVPTTTQEYKDYLLAFKDSDYNGNGEADEIGLTGELDSVEYTLEGSFGLMNRGSSHPDVFVDDEGELQYAYSSDRYKEFLGYMNELYTEGLLDQDIFTVDYAQIIAKAQVGRTATYMFVNNSPVSNSPYEEYSYGFREPLEGPSGYKNFTVYSLPASTAGQFMITYKCAEKGEDAIKAAVRWMDYWYSEEGIIRYFMGVEGETYEKDENSPGGLKLTDNVLNSPDGLTFEQVLAAYVPWAGGSNPSVATNEFFKGGETWPVCLDSAEGLRNYLPETIWTSFSSYYTVDEADEMSSLKTDLDTYKKEWRGYFISGQKSLETDWDEYVAGYNGLNLDR